MSELSEPMVGDLLVCSRGERIYIGILREEFYLVGDRYSSFRVMWVEGQEPIVYNDEYGIYSLNIKNSLSEYSYFRDGREMR